MSCTTTETKADPAVYSDGDIPMELRSKVELSPTALEGTWEVIKDRSDGIDGLLGALGLGMIVRAAMRAHTPKTVIQKKPPCPGRSDGPLAVVSHLPFGKTKGGDIPVDGGSFVVDDTDTKVSWQSFGLLHEGRLLQRRESSKGVMFDVRCVFARDPEGKCDASPVQLFRWTFVAAGSGKTFVANRWMRRLGDAQ